MNPRVKAFIYLHIAVFLWGFTAILGKLISYESLQLVWHRMLLTATIYFLFPIVWKNLRKMQWKDISIFLGIGLIVCLHWLTFYGSIKLGNSASVTLACLGTASFFSALLEPIISKKPFRRIEILLGLLVVTGIVLIYFAMPDENDAGVNYFMAIVTGVASAFLASLFTVLNKVNLYRTTPLTLSALEMSSGAIVLTIVMSFMPYNMCTIPAFSTETGNYDLLWILLLVVVCTNLTFYLGSHSLQHMSAFTANLTVNLEPVYGIVLGAVIFKEHEQLNAWFYAGALLVLITVFAQSFMDYYNKRKRKDVNIELLIRE